VAADRHFGEAQRHQQADAHGRQEQADAAKAKLPRTSELRLNVTGRFFGR
jgi:hypothetical protein